MRCILYFIVVYVRSLMIFFVKKCKFLYYYIEKSIKSWLDVLFLYRINLVKFGIEKDFFKYFIMIKVN